MYRTVELDFTHLVLFHKFIQNILYLALFPVENRSHDTVPLKGKPEKKK